MSINVFVRTGINADGLKYRMTVKQEVRSEINYYLSRIDSHVQLLDRIFHKRCDKVENILEE